MYRQLRFFLQSCQAHRHPLRPSRIKGIKTSPGITGPATRNAILIDVPHAKHVG